MLSYLSNNWKLFSLISFLVQCAYPIKYPTKNNKNLLFETSLKIHAMTMKSQDFSIRMEGI